MVIVCTKCGKLFGEEDTGMVICPECLDKVLFQLLKDLGWPAVLDTDNSILLDSRGVYN